MREVVMGYYTTGVDYYLVIKVETQSYKIMNYYQTVKEEDYHIIKGEEEDYHIVKEGNYQIVM